MKIKYLCHSSFLLESESRRRIITDPFICNPESRPVVRADVTLISHQHSDHSNLNLVSGPSQVVFGCGRHNVEGFSMEGILLDHGSLDGHWLGNVIGYKIEIDGLKCLHLSDVGRMPASGEIEWMKETDILFIPVGGHFTIGPDKAGEIADAISPAIIIPMHFHVAGMDRRIYPLEGIESFVTDRNNVKHYRDGVETINLDNLPAETEIHVLTPIY